MELGAPSLSTSLIRLEPLSEEHRHILSQTDAVDHMWSSMPVIATGTNFDAYFDHTIKMAELGTGLGLAAINIETGNLVGLAAFLSPNRLNRRTRIGYTWLRKELRGTSVNDHIQFLLLKRAFQWRARRVEWWIATRNERAIGSVEKIGAVFEGTLRSHTRFSDGTWADIAVYSLVSDEIRKAMVDLSARIDESYPAQ
jgi:RimJ/RimL family protein N-acetyltransferase